MPCAGDGKQCRKLIELTGEVAREAPDGKDRITPDYSDQRMIVNLFCTLRESRSGRQRRQDEATLAELPRLWDVEEMAAATKTDFVLEQLWAWKNRPWEQIMREGLDPKF